MRPDSPRADIVDILRQLSALIRNRLPRRVRADDVFLGWETTGPLLLARVARQGETLALLIESAHELDAEMVMRSLLEHVTLFAWLAITPDDPSRTWRARNPSSNTEWWMVDQYRREKTLSEHQGKWLGVMTADVRAALKTMKDRVNALPSRGEFPTVAVQADEVDAYWGRRLAGWSQAEPRSLGFAVTFRGHYWTLYARGSSSVHPDYGAIRRFATPPAPSGYQRHHIVREAANHEVDVFLSISAFLIGNALAVADAALGWDGFDAALHLLGRWAEVRAPDLLIEGVLDLLDRREGRKFAQCDRGMISIELRDGELTVVSTTEDGSWHRLSHRLGTRDWVAGGPTGDIQVGAGTIVEVGPYVMARLEDLASVAHMSWSSARPATWPEAVA